MKRDTEHVFTRRLARRTARIPLLGLLMAGACALLVSALDAGTQAQAQVPPYKLAHEQRMSPKADQVLRAMSTRLASANQFTLRGHRTVDPGLVAGADVPREADVRVSVERPDMLYAEVQGSGDHRKMYYDGKTFSLVDVTQGLYATKPVPGNIDVLVRRLDEKFGFTPPLSDLVVADPYQAMTRYVEAGKYLGEEKLDGKRVDHLRFEEDYVRWDMWIDRQDKLPVKVVAWSMTLPGQPKYVVDNISVNLSPQLSNELFTFEPTGDMHEIPMVPAGQPPSSSK